MKVFFSMKIPSKSIQLESDLLQYDNVCVDRDRKLNL